MTNSFYLLYGVFIYLPNLSLPYISTHRTVPTLLAYLSPSYKVRNFEVLPALPAFLLT